MQNRLEAAERAAKALHMRTMRYSYDSIAKACGYGSKGAAFKAVQRELAKVAREPAKELRIAELEALDVAERALATRLARGELAAIDRMLKIKDMRAKLTGLYEEQTDNGVGEVKAVFAAFMAQVEADVAQDEADDELERELAN
jgi:hypothetical protein